MTVVAPVDGLMDLRAGLRCRRVGGDEIVWRASSTSSDLMGETLVSLRRFEEGVVIASSISGVAVVLVPLT